MLFYFSDMKHTHTVTHFFTINRYTDLPLEMRTVESEA